MPPATPGPLGPSSPTGHTSPWQGVPAVHHLWCDAPISDTGVAQPLILPVHQAVYLPVEYWPPYAFDVRDEGGIQWNWHDIRRFLDKCVVSGKHALWQGAKSRGQGNRQWYGSFHTQGKTVRAHKFAAIAILGLRPGPGDEVDHHCHDTGCVSCLRVLTRQQNQDLIRRPSKQVLDLAKACNMTPAEVMRLSDDKIAAYSRLLDTANRINRGEHVPGVIVCGRTGNVRKRRRTQ